MEEYYYLSHLTLISGGLKKYQRAVTNLVFGSEISSLCCRQGLLKGWSKAVSLLQERFSLHHLATISNGLPTAGN
jgi:hypothetical protein